MAIELAGREVVD